MCIRDRLRKAFAKSKSQLTMLLELRHQPKNARVREIIERGDIGEVCQITTQKSYKWGERAEWFKTRARLGGTIPYIGIHSLDTIRWVTGLDFIHLAAIHGQIGRPEMGETECHASVLGELSNGASVTARIDYLRPAIAVTHSDDRLRVVGTKGVVEAFLIQRLHLRQAKQREVIGSEIQVERGHRGFSCGASGRKGFAATAGILDVRVVELEALVAVSYTHLTLPTNREV